MYESYFGLKENPFRLSPDPRFLYWSVSHRDALNHILYGIGERKGFIVITGGIGTGKTTLCRALLKSLDETVHTALVFNPAVSDTDLLEMVLDEFRVPLPEGDRTKKRLMDALNLFLLDNYTAGRNAVLIIDEAQNLSHHVLEEVRLLSNLETDSEKLIQIVLVGQPELKRLLALPSLAQLNQRITVRCHLTPLARREMAPYLACRLSVADRGRNLAFSAGACELLYRYSRGNPRYINAICDRALLGAYAQNTHTIDARLLRKAVRDLGEGYLADRRWFPLFSTPVLSWSLLAALLVLAGAILYMSRNVLTK